jgi:predicted metalloprotease with PDZ domain
MLSTALPAQESSRDSGGPIAAPIPQTVPDARDTPWPGGTIKLDIDASDTVRGLYRVTETIPVAAGTPRITLMLPRWLPGNHGPRGPVAELADLRFEVNGKAVAWQRDPVEVAAFHVELPDGAREVVAKFVHTSPLETNQGRITVTPDMLNLQWEKMSLYPAGHYIRRIRIKPAVTLPQGWQVATALDGKSMSGSKVTWAETDYETLVDSPIFAGRYFRQWSLGNQTTLNVVTDEPELLEARPENIAKLSALVEEARLALGPPNFDHYEFLVALSDQMGDIGLEHLRSSENEMKPKNFIEWSDYDWDRNVLGHELTHSWNGKYRRPARLWTPDYRTPMQDDLLWVYEGQTQFWGWVLSARSGSQSKDQVLGMIAGQAGKYAELPGRQWRSVEDTTFDPVFAARKPRPYASLTRDEDYYNEGALVWLEADQIIRAGTGGRKGLDDFARTFFGHTGDGYNTAATRVKTYEFDDVVAGLNAIYPYDWAKFLDTRIRTPGQPAPLAGIEKAGYRLVWKDVPNPYDKARMANARNLVLTNSLGLTIDKDGDVGALQWNGPAFTAGVVGGMKLLAVNGLAYDAEKLKDAITDARTSGKPIELLVRRGDRFQTIAVPYKGGLRWPWLERTTKGPAPLDTLLAPRRAIK